MCVVLLMKIRTVLWNPITNWKVSIKYFRRFLFTCRWYEGNVQNKTYFETLKSKKKVLSI